MPTATDEHPPLAALIACGQGRLTPDERRAIEDHVQHCDHCVKALWSKGDSPPSLTPARKPEAGGVPRELRDHPRYRILGPLGAGGMGVVYKAEHLMMGRTVALKVIAPRFLANPDAIERFRREVRTAAKLAHPNIVTAHDADSAGGLHFLVMEYVEGLSLDRVVAKRGPQPIATACQCVRQAALGLQHASALGMVHRDIKPHNLMVTRKGQVKILDFGLARFASETDSAMERTGTGRPAPAGVTTASTVIGTPDYLAPEQARCSGDVDIRADIYGLGCTLYFLLSGRAPFADLPSASEKMLAHTRAEPPKLSELRGDVPAGLIAVLAKMTAKDPADRYGTPAEVAAALQPFTKAGAVLEAEAVEEEPAARVEAAAVGIAAPKLRKSKRNRRRKARPGPGSRFAIGAGVLGILGAIALGLILARALSRTPAITVEPVKPGPTAPAAALARTSKVLIVLPNVDVHFDEYAPLRRGLESRGLTCVVAAKKRTACSPERGQWPPVQPDLALSEVDPADYDAVVFPGANPGDYLQPPRDGPALAVKSIIDRMLAQSKPVAGIGRGQGALLAGGYLDDRPAAFNPDVQSQFPQRPVQWQRDRRVVEAGCLLTAGGAGEADALAQAIARRIAPPK